MCGEGVVKVVWKGVVKDGMEEGRRGIIEGKGEMGGLEMGK